MLAKRFGRWLKFLPTLLLAVGFTLNAHVNHKVIKIAFLTADPAQIEALYTWTKRFEIANPS